MNFAAWGKEAMELLSQHRLITIVERRAKFTHELFIVLMNIAGHLSFNRASSQTLHQILLEEQNYQHDGNGG